VQTFSNLNDGWRYTAERPYTIQILYGQ